MIRRAEWLAVAKDRSAVILLSVVFFLTLSIILLTAIRIHASDVQVPIRYTGYGVNNIQRDQWYHQAAFAAFAVVITTVNVFLAVRLRPDRALVSYGILGLSIFILTTTLFVANAIFNLTPSI